jgi:branched-chain amino acid transport system ATP-binding protein
MTAALRTENLSRSFGALAAVSDVSFSLPQGARHALIGPNGAGKTTFINLLAGALAPSRGEVYVGEERITPLRQHRRVKLGLTRTFQISQLFPNLTVLESVMLPILERTGKGARFARDVAAHREETDEALALLASMRLADDAPRRSAHLPYGKQRLLEIALALATRRDPAPRRARGGHPAAESVAVLGAIAALPADVTVLFIEHDMSLVFRFAERITVLVGGKSSPRARPRDRRRRARAGRLPRARAPWLRSSRCTA